MRIERSTIPDEIMERLGVDAERVLANSFAGGLAIGVTDRERTLAVATFGHADMAAGTPMRPETLFEIGSISKGFACVCVLQAQSEGLLDVHHPVTEYLPWFNVRSWYEPITPHHLMSHTAGIIMGSDLTNDAMFDVWALRETEATTPPGTYFHYSNVGYKALGLMLEAVEGKPYPTILRERVLMPLGMHGTESAITHSIRHRLAAGYVPLYDDRPQRRQDGLVPATWLESAAADGSISSTAGNMTLYLRMLLNGGRGPNRPVLSPEDFEAMTSGVIASEEEEPASRYGYGIVRAEVDGHVHLCHTGSMVGYQAAMRADLDGGVGVIVLASGSGAWWTLARHVLATVRASAGGAPLPDLALPVHEENEDALRGEPAPPEFEPYVGHYRCHNPWLTNFRVVARGGGLWMVTLESDQPSAPMTPLRAGTFRVGKDERSPERLSFDTLVEGRAIRATYSGHDYYRTFTP